ncbi:MAG: hypothetical protein MJA30_16715 [Cytophagales bacterium]|nr:hypothetical protein [Cytophagales bacterium]
MKKMIFSALLLTVLSSAYAIEKNKINVISDSSAVFKIYYSTPVTSRVKIAIYNQAGERVFQEVIRTKESFVRPYNMKELPNGTYTFEISDNEEVKRFEYAYNDNVSMGNEPTSDIYVNVTQLDDARYLLALENANNEKVSVKIYNENSDMIYSGSELVEEQFAQLYNLKSAQTGTVTFKVYSGKEVIKEIIF